MLRQTRLGLVLFALALAPVAPASGEVLSRLGAVTAPAAPPATVVTGVLESDTDVLLFLEQENLELTTDVAVDISVPGVVLADGDLTPGSVPAGTFVDSWFLHADAIGIGPVRLSGAVRFDRPILGVLTHRNRLIASESLLGNPGTTYAGVAGHTDPDSGDRLSLSDDRRTLGISWLVADQVDHVRVLTEGTADATYLASYAQLLSTRASRLDASGDLFDFAFDNGFSVGDPTKIVVVTPAVDVNIFTSGWSGISTNPHAVWYDPARQRWLVRRSIASNPDLGGMHVLVLDASGDAFVHTTDASNTVSNWSCFDHPDADGNPDARVLVSRNAGTGATPIHHDHFVGVYYEFSTGKWCIFNQDRLNMAFGRSFNVMVLPDDGTSFVHTTDAGNAFASTTVIDHPLLNDRPDRTPHITALWNPGGIGGVYDDRAHAVRYSEVSGRWSIAGVPGELPLGSSFNVYVPPAPSHAHRHVADASNSFFHESQIAHPHLDGRRSPVLLETQNLAGGAAANPHATGTWFNGFQHELFNQDFATWPLGSATNVFRVPSGRRSFVHVAESPYNVTAWSFLDHWQTVRHPEALVFVAQNWNPNEFSGTYNDHVIGVWYDAIEEDWAVLNEDLATMPVGAGFNVYVAPPDADAFVHVADASNTTGSVTSLDHALLNGQPDAAPMVTQNWNPGSIGVLNDHPVAVDYDAGAGRWQIVNQDGASIPTGAGFNVMPLPEPGAGWMLASGAWLLALLHRKRRSA